MLVLESLYKSYGNTKVLKDINMDIEPGCITGIVGENGAGKTTLFKCITGLESCKGRISYPHNKFQHVIGFLPTNPYMLSKITGSEYLRFICKAREIDMPHIEENNLFDLPLHKYADTYSTGMKKKLALTGILLQKNEVFILDEPFNGVDIQSNFLIKEILDKLKEHQKTILISSHIFSILFEICDKLHHLSEGKLVQSVDQSKFHEVEEGMKSKNLSTKLDQIFRQGEL